MTIEQIIEKREQLDKQLKVALASMEHKDTIKEIRAAIKANQDACPHFDANYNYAWINDTCPYCGKPHAIKE